MAITAMKTVGTPVSIDTLEPAECSGCGTEPTMSNPVRPVIVRDVTGTYTVHTCDGCWDSEHPDLPFDADLTTVTS